MDPVKFVVIGLPSQQAGMRSVDITTKSGKKITRQITTGGKDLKSWRAEVSDAAKAQAEAVGCLHGALRMRVQFRFPMPKSRPAGLRLLGIGWKTTAPDLDKLVRAIGDSLTTSGLIPDDAVIAETRSSKIEVYEQWTGAVIELTVLPALGEPAPRPPAPDQGSLL